MSAPAALLGRAAIRLDKIIGACPLILKEPDMYCHAINDRDIRF